MTARAEFLGHPIHYENGVWKITETGETLYSPDMAGSGQYGRCISCGLSPTPEGHDGCLGTLVDKNKEIWNSCCGHSNTSQAYIQYSDKTVIRGEEAIKEQQRLIKERDNES